MTRIPSLLTGTLTLALALALFSSNAHAQDATTSDDGAIIINPPQPQASSTFDYWWPYPAPAATTPMAAPMTTPTDAPNSVMTSPAAAVSSTTNPAVNLFPTVNISMASLSLMSSSGPSSSSSSGSSISSSSTTDSIISLTATSSPTPSAQDEHSSSSHHVFKIIYLTPVFVLIGLVLGATFGGMIYRRCTRRSNARPRETSGESQLRDDRDAFTQFDVLAYPYPRSKTTKLELGEGYGQLADKEFEDASDGDSEAGRSDYYEDVSPNKRSPYKAYFAALQGTTGLGSGSKRSLRSSASSNHTLLPSPSTSPGKGASPSSSSSPAANKLALARPWYDRLPGMSAQIPPTPSSNANDPEKATPAPTPGSFKVEPMMSPSDTESDRLVSRDIRSHSSIRRAIADRLRVGSRRTPQDQSWTPSGGAGDTPGSSARTPATGGSAKGYLRVDLHDEDDDDEDGHGGGVETSVRRASGNQPRRTLTSGTGLLQQRRVTTRGGGVGEEGAGAGGIMALQYGSKKGPVDDEGVSTPLRREHDALSGGDDDDDDDVEIGNVSVGGRVLSSASSILPKPQQRSGSNKLRLKAKPTKSGINSPLDGSNDILPPRSTSKYTKRSSASGLGAPGVVSPVHSDDEGEETPPTLRLLNPPRRVISPPAHPDLFFADPVLGNYIVDRDRDSEPRSSASKPRGVGGPSNANPKSSDPKHVTKAVRKLQRLKPPAESSPSSSSPSTTAHEAETSGAESSFHNRPMKSVRTREALGAVDDIMKSGYGARAEERERGRVQEREREKGTKRKQLRDAGLGMPPR